MASASLVAGNLYLLARWPASILVPLLELEWSFSAEEQGHVDCFPGRLGTRPGIGGAGHWSWDGGSWAPRRALAPGQAMSFPRGETVQAQALEQTGSVSSACTHILTVAFQFCSILLYCTVFTAPLNPLNWQVYFLFVCFLIVITFSLNNLSHSPGVFSLKLHY